MSCITRLLEMKGDKSILPIHDSTVIEGGGNYKGHEYLITFVDRGHRCGYVALKDKAFEKFEAERKGEQYYYPDLDCHGGVTFYDNQHGAKALLDVHCDDIWIGFDAAHYLDASCVDTSVKYFGETRQTKFMRENTEFYENVFHRSYKYMEEECKKLIDQLEEIENDQGT